jgi:hypothetical protein
MTYFLSGQRLVDCGSTWLDEIKAAGELPVIGRVVELLSQSEFMRGETWPTILSTIDKSGMRSQWSRAWLPASRARVP